jgi:hypothetical protein
VIEEFGASMLYHIHHQGALLGRRRYPIVIIFRVITVINLSLSNLEMYCKRCAIAHETCVVIKMICNVMEVLIIFIMAPLIHSTM